MSERKVSTDALETLGKIISPDEKRDAIHLAVMPVQLGESVKPGESLNIAPEDGKAYSAGGLEGSLLIADPFIRSYRLPEGAWIWAILRPRQVTSLRHVWEHPSFPETFIPQASDCPDEYEGECSGC
jgi:hypothetical protein